MDSTKQTSEEHRKIDQLKSEFVSTVSHELRTPLAIIREGISLLHDKILGETNEKQSEILTYVITNADRLSKTINDLLDISQLEAGKAEIHKTEIDARALINELIKHNKKFSMMSYPNRTHAIKEGKNTRRHLYELLTGYLKENLPAGAKPIETLN